jgi:sporulation protein YhbH
MTRKLTAPTALPNPRKTGIGEEAMFSRIDQDQSRFRQIVRGKVRENLRKYMKTGELIGRQGRDVVSIPIPQVDIPQFRFGRKQTGGVGQGEGEPGTPIGFDPDQPGEGDEAGNTPGGHILEVEVTLEELARILGDELELPNIEPKGKENIESRIDRYTGIRRVGPESLRHFKRTYREALKRQVALGVYNRDNPVVVPVREDKRYRSWNTHYAPDSNAAIIYMMDVSGSMYREKKEIVRLTAFWIDTWLRSQYKNVDVRYIIHDAAAREVDQNTFYHTRESGGTAISSAYRLCRDIIFEEYHPAEWNIYPFHFTDGDNWEDDNTKCAELLLDSILPFVNLFCYGEVRGPRGRSRFMRELQKLSGSDGASENGASGDDGRLIAAKIRGKDSIYDAIKTFLGNGQ